MLREDEVGQCFTQEKVLANAPEQSEGMFQVPKNRLGENSVTVSRLTIHELHDLLVNKEISATELTQEHLNRIQALDGDVNAYITVTGDLALEQAKAVDAKIAAGETIGALAGIPMAVKDNMCTEGINTTCASKMLEDFKPQYSATVVKKSCRRRSMSCWAKSIWMSLPWAPPLKTLPFLPQKSMECRLCARWFQRRFSSFRSCRFGGVLVRSDTGGSIRQPASFSAVL